MQVKYKSSYLILLVTFVLVLLGCTAEEYNLYIVSDDKTQITSEIKQHIIPDVATVYEVSDEYSVELSYGSNELESFYDQIQLAKLKIKNIADGKSIDYNATFYLGNFDDNPVIEILKFSNYDIIVVRVPFLHNEEMYHRLLFFYFDNQTLQILGEDCIFPVISADFMIRCDIENSVFAFTDINGDSETYTVVAEEINSEITYYLRSADYEPAPCEIKYKTKFGDLCFAYSIYEQTNERLKISPHNYVKIIRNNGNISESEVKSPVYQPVMSFDGLAQICSKIEFEIIELSDWGIAAVRVPVISNNGIETQVVSMFYFDNVNLLPLEQGAFFPEVLVDSQIAIDYDNDCFSITTTKGNISWYTVADSPEVIHKTSYVKLVMLND